MASPGDDDNGWWQRWQEKQSQDRPHRKQAEYSSTVSSETQTHLQRVYLNLSLTSVAAAAASYLFLQRLLPNPGGLQLVASLASIVGVGLVPRRLAPLRHGLLYLFGFTQGWGLGPLLNYTLHLDPVLPFTALVGTAAIFLSFTMTAMMTERRSQLYLGGFLGAAGLILALMGLAQMFIGSEWLFSAEIYLGLLMLSGYVVFDTQVMIERSEEGRRDVPGDAANLFINLFGIFARLLIIFARQNQDERDKKRRNHK